ncbi:hypothetical protein CKF54_02995 [Psittacicella hinzii]|uniref:PTS EIIB type-1 domain-containing protein n=1 Tax=Psittacicella hinzii TaxID=2028575 RepID=A0A3A1YB64_9GAMM|nr:PTS transporter subunit EIIB [Psittacicella hinzii]RIY33357.1 hypothetical protein CKF54_02995 [Psittacicella hinzii]
MAVVVNKQAVSDLIKLVGGTQNIASVTHCVTRLRFVLNDPSVADEKAILELPFVKGAFTNLNF